MPQTHVRTQGEFDAVVIGAGAAGLMCAGMAGQRGLKVLLVDHSAKVAEKIRISGGGRCNFTNRLVGPENFVSENPAFCHSALARYTPADFLALLGRHGVQWHEKHRGQLFSDAGSGRVIEALLAECAAGCVARWQPCRVLGVSPAASGFTIGTDRGEVGTRAIVVASGGLSVPALGASDFGYRLARQFGHGIIEPRPALVPLTFDPTTWKSFAALAGVALEVGIETGVGRSRARFQEDLLFTHRGLSGPAVLQISSHWRPGAPIRIDLSPGLDLGKALLAAKASSKRQIGSELAMHLPQRLAATWLVGQAMDPTLPLSQARDRDLLALAESLHRWNSVPNGSEGWRKAEVTAGGVDTRELSSQTFESSLQPGLHFIGEVVDVTGWLGGYNFQWAWASGAACARGLRVS